MQSESRAAKLFSNALSELEKDEVSFTLLCEEAYDTALRRFLQDWQRILGVNCSVTLETVTAAELTRRVAAGAYEIAFYPVRASFYAPAAYFSQFDAAAGGTLCAIDDENYTKAVRALRFAEAGELAAAQKQAEQMLTAAAVVLPVWQESTVFVCRGDVTGVRLLSGADRLYLHNAETHS